MNLLQEPVYNGFCNTKVLTKDLILITFAYEDKIFHKWSDLYVCFNSEIVPELSVTF